MDKGLQEMLRGKDFSDAKWRDIEDTRARLEAYKNRCQPYPAIEQASSPLVPVIPAQPWQRNQWDKVQQLQSEVEGWREKHAEALLAIDRFTALLAKKGKRYEKYKDS